MSRHTRFHLLLWPAAIVVACASLAQASVEGRASGAVGQTMTGGELFQTYCASCHGSTGTGNGPMAAALRRTPPDITGLALANGGVFPADRMRRIIDGREVGSHGDREMPVWGDAFKAISGGHSDEAVRARIAAVLEYLASIQRRHV